MKKSLHLAASAVVLALGVGSARAATISSTTSYTTLSSIGSGATVGTAGFLLAGSTISYDIGGGSNPAGPVISTYGELGNSGGNSWGSWAAGPLTYNNGSPTTLATNVTGVYGSPVSPAGSGVTIASFTTAGTAEFQLTLLLDIDTDKGQAQGSQYIVTDVTTGGSGTITATPYNSTFSASGGRYGVLDFYSIDISGASAGDVITITGGYDYIASNGGLQNSDNVLGGVLFDPVPTPEPSALSLLGVGLVSLLARRRRKTASTPEQDRIMGSSPDQFQRSVR